MPNYKRERALIWEEFFFFLIILIDFFGELCWSSNLYSFCGRPATGVGTLEEGQPLGEQLKEDQPWFCGKSTQGLQLSIISIFQSKLYQIWGLWDFFSTHSLVTFRFLVWRVLGITFRWSTFRSGSLNPNIPTLERTFFRFEAFLLLPKPRHPPLAYTVATIADLEQPTAKIHPSNQKSSKSKS